jgi:hypothetical protein
LAISGAFGQTKIGPSGGQRTGTPPVPVTVPCYRKLRDDGSVGGFVLGTEWGKRLLQLGKSFVKTKASSKNSR